MFIVENGKIKEQLILNCSDSRSNSVSTDDNLRKFSGYLLRATKKSNISILGFSLSGRQDSSLIPVSFYCMLK